MDIPSYSHLAQGKDLIIKPFKIMNIILHPKSCMQQISFRDLPKNSNSTLINHSKTIIKNFVALDMQAVYSYISLHDELWKVFMHSFMRITKALADKNRIRILLALDGCELCVCQIIELLELAPSTVSKHMSVLSQAHLIKGRKEGRWRYYRLAGDDASYEVREALAWVYGSISKTSKIRQDATRLKDIFRLDPKELCRIKGKTLTLQPLPKDNDHDQKD